MLRASINISLILSLLTIGTIFLNGCSVDQIYQYQEKEDALDAKEEVIIDTETNNSSEELKEDELVLPASVLERGFTNEEEREQNDDSTYAYVLYGSPCRPEYMQRDFKANCLLQIVDLQKDEIVSEFQASENGVFEIENAEFAPPTAWYDHETLLIETGFGDAGIAIGKYEAFNIRSNKLEHLVSYDAVSSIGTLYTIDGKKLFFQEDSDGSGDLLPSLTIYEVPEDINDIFDIEDLDVSTFKKLNQLEGGTWSEYRAQEGLVIYVDSDSDYNADSIYSYDVGENTFTLLASPI